MNIEDLRTFIRNIETNQSDSVQLKLVVKANNVYQGYNVVLDRNLRLEMKEMYQEILSTRLFDLEQEQYNPNIVQDESLAVCSLDTANIENVLMDLELEENNADDVNNLDLNDVNFYLIKFNYNDKTAYFFRRFTKMRKMRKGIVGTLDGNTFHKIDRTLFVGLDSEIDIVVYEQEALILNRFSLQTIFNMHDYFIDRANEALDRIRTHNIVDNFENFQEDCIRDRQAVKRMTKIMNTENRLNEFIAHASKIPYVIQEANLDIEVNDQGSIVYDGTKECRSQILFCMADAYYLSLLLERLGEDIAQ